MFDGVTSRCTSPAPGRPARASSCAKFRPLRDLGGDVQRQRLGDDLARAVDLLHDHAQVVALDEFEDDEVFAGLRDPEIVDLDDVAVRERRVDARLGEQHLDEAVVLREVGRIRLIATSFSKPSAATTRPLKTSAMPPTAICSRARTGRTSCGRLTSVNRNDVPGLRPVCGDPSVGGYLCTTARGPAREHHTPTISSTADADDDQAAFRRCRSRGGCW
jgi:hypothetical protein